MILPGKGQRDPKLITMRRGGMLNETNHHHLALWAAECAEHVLHLFEEVRPQDGRPRQAIRHARAWTLGKVKMKQARQAAGAANDAARDLTGAARHAAHAAAQAAVVAHVAEHELGAAAYAIKAVRASVAEGEQDEAGRRECLWQRGKLPEEIRELVLDDQRRRNALCWFLFER